MKKLNYIALILLSHCFVCIGLAQANSPDFNALSDSVFLLKANNSDACATGFLDSDGYLITNSHVISLICPGRNCSNLIIKKASRLNGPASLSLAFNSISITKDFPGLDVVFLKVDFKNKPKGLIKLQDQASLSPELYLLGFPHCETLKLSRGQVLEKDLLRYTTSAAGAHGSSGSPLIDSNYNLLGVADEATSAAGALASLLFAKDFSLRTLRADVIYQLFNANATETALYQGQLLNTFYKNEVRDKTGLGRLMAGTDFLHLVEAYRKRLSEYKKLSHESAALAYLGEHIAFLPFIMKASQAALSLESEKLYAAYSIEKLGLRQRMFHALDTAAFKAKIHSLEYPAEHKLALVELIDYAKQDDYMGSAYYSYWLGAKATFVLMLILVIWGWSLGYSFRHCHGSLLKKTMTMLAVAFLFWPFSFAFFLAQSRSTTKH